MQDNIPSTVERAVKFVGRQDGAIGVYRILYEDVTIPNQGGHDQMIFDVIKALREKGWEVNHVIETASKREFL